MRRDSSIQAIGTHPARRRKTRFDDSPDAPHFPLHRLKGKLGANLFDSEKSPFLMFDSLQNNLKSAFKSISGKGKLTESNMRDGLKLVEQSLLEADVSYDVVKEFMAKVTAEATGDKVLLALNPTEQFVGVVNQQLVDLLGPVEEELRLDKAVNIIMMCGLQGAGKTTTCGKLAKLLMRQKVKPMLVAADLQRPAAIDQLHVIGEQVGVPVYSDRENKDPVKVCRDAVAKAKEEGVSVVILDTAGRLAIDEELMEQLKTIDRDVQPDHVFLVVDGMTGQDAVRSAGAFHDALELNGVVMTKLDGDTRGGALLSVKQVTGVPIRFIGVGEHLDDLEFFRPEGMAGRILGQGDIVGLFDVASQIADEEEQARMQESLEKGQFTMDDFRNHMQKIAKPGLMQKMMGLMPGMGQMKEMMDQVSSSETSSQVKRMVGIIDSMTSAERKDPSIVDARRRQRIASGAGAGAQAVNELIKRYDMMKGMMTGMAGMGASDRVQQMQEMQQAMMDPSKKRMPGSKKPTGRALTKKEKAKRAKDRAKQLKQMKKDRKNNRRKPGEDAV
jgi:signal recognition particle subunit SRP54